MGAWIAYMSRGITDFEKCYHLCGVLIGVYMSVSVKMISVALSVIVENRKYRYENFPDSLDIILSLEMIPFLYKAIIEDIIYRCKKYSLFR